MVNTVELDHCAKDALTGFLGLMLQAILAGLAFTCLIAKRFREPPGVRRPWQVWWYDTSKQGIGAIVIHITNICLAPLFQGDPCTWYVINFLLDSTIGLLIVFIGIRLCQFLAFHKQWPAINFGVYDAPKSWIFQTCIYVGLMALVKIATTLFIQWKFWDNVKNLVLSPFSNETIELILFMLVIPFFVNLLIFWVTDNFLMRHDQQTHQRSFLIKYVSRINKNATNGTSNGNSPTTNGTSSTHTNGKFKMISNCYERTKDFCTNRFDIDISSKKLSQNNKQHRYDIFDNDSESDSLLTGDDRLEVELTDDDCASLEPRNCPNKF